jgi:hypothetical protein
MDWTFLKDLLFGIFRGVNNYLQAIPTWVGIAAFIFLFFPSLEWKMKNKLTTIRKYRLHILMIFLMISMVITSYSLYVNKTPDLATPNALLSDNLTGLKIRVVDLGVGNPLVSGKVFKDCLFYGPGIISIHANCTGTIAVELHEDITLDATLIETTNERIVGVVIFDNCVFINCRIRDIGIIGSSELITEIKAKLEPQ